MLRHQRRGAVAGEAQMPPGLDAFMAVLGRKMGNTRDQSPELREPAACQPIKSLHHVIDDAQRTERT